MGRALAAIMHVPVARGVLHLSLLTCSFLAINSAAAKDCGAPKSIRPLEGLIAESNVRQGDASIISDISSKRVAIVVSSNAEKQLAWNESLRQPPTGIYRLTLDLSGRLVQWEQASRDTYDPKAIVAGMAGAIAPRWLDEWRRWHDLPAVRANKLFVVDANLLHRSGPRFVDGVEQLCDVIERARAP